MRDTADPIRPTPQLLVSVRNTLEAASAIAGGCQILDVKEPSRGSLGFAGIETIAAIAEAGGDAGLSVSAALGEVIDWIDRDVPQLAAGLRFAKLGLSQLGGKRDWRESWSSLRRRFAPSEETGWIAVAYADWTTAGAPHPDGVIDAAIDTRCAGVLFDTWDKGQPRLTELVGSSQLAGWIDRIRGAGLLAGLAGRLDATALAQLPSMPDILAVRSSACVDGNRAGPISVEAVRRLRQALSR